MNWNGLELPDRNVYFKDDAVVIYHSDCRDILPLISEKSIDLVLTDPPYPKEYIELFSVLSESSKTLLKEGCPLLCYSGQLHLPEVISRLSEHLEYRWCIALLHRESQIVWGSRMIASWKPILVFQSNHSKADIHRDVIDPSGRVKDLHHWQQNDKDIGSLILDYTVTDNLILDPFLGSGTTCYCAKKLNRYSIGIEISEKYCEIAAKRCSQGILLVA